MTEAEWSTMPKVGAQISVFLSNPFSLRTCSFSSIFNYQGLHSHFCWVQYPRNKAKKGKIKQNHKHLNRINFGWLSFDYIKDSMSFCSELLPEWIIYKIGNILPKWTGKKKGEGRKRKRRKEEGERKEKNV